MNVGPVTNTTSRTASDRGVVESNGPTEAENLDRVRDILFGSFAREFQSRLQELDEHVERHAATLTDRLDRTESALELRAEQIFDEFTGRLEAETRERTEVFETLSKGVKKLSARLEAQARALDERLTATSQEAEAKLKAQASTLAKAIAKSAGELKATLETMHAQLRHEKVDRASLADLLSSVSAGLVGDGAPPQEAPDEAERAPEEAAAPPKAKAKSKSKAGPKTKAKPTTRSKSKVKSRARPKSGPKTKPATKGRRPKAKAKAAPRKKKARARR